VKLRQAQLAIIVAAGLVSMAGSGAVEALDLQSVRDGDGRFTISVPSTWEIDQSRKDRAFSAKSPEPPGMSPDTIEVFVRDTIFPLSPEACAAQVAWVMRMTIHEWTTLSEGTDSIGGLAAYSRAYIWHLKNGEERRSIQACIPVGRRVFVIIGTTRNSPDRIAETFPELTRMIATFRPGPAPTPAPAGPSSETGPAHLRVEGGSSAGGPGASMRAAPDPAVCSRWRNANAGTIPRTATASPTIQTRVKLPVASRM
jgi:hypothetical protein